MLYFYGIRGVECLPLFAYIFKRYCYSTDKACISKSNHDPPKTILQLYSLIAKGLEGFIYANVPGKCGL